MKTFEGIRIALFTMFKSVHEGLFPSVPINFPYFSVIDAEKLSGAFVSVQLVYKLGVEVLDTASSDDIVRGELLVSYLYPSGTGLNSSFTYSDMLRDNFSNCKVQDVTFFEMKVLDVSPAPGIVGQMNVLPFMI